MKSLELLSPALNLETAMQAILHGADAVYIGGPSHGARKTASNNIEDIEKLVDFAHTYRVKVYATVNTIIYNREIKAVEILCRDLYHVGVDALIIQDMGILRMNLPPISLHASTQCDIRTPEKALFFQKVGFSQLVLARELSLSEIKEISSAITIPIETFVHGALCVSYSGRCHASFATTGRSANRGECAQICRYPFTLRDKSGQIIAKDKYLLSLKDLNLSNRLEDLIEAGVSSFKIEGRLKDVGYVKNITALYNSRLNAFIKNNKDRFTRSSYGLVKLNFEPKADKSFNRDFSEYFLMDRKPLEITSHLSPKSKGEKITDITELNNGDGISFFDKEGNFTGVNINKIENGKIITARKKDIPKNAEIFRTSDIKWNKLMGSQTAERKIPINIKLETKGISASDVRGVKITEAIEITVEKSDKELDYEKIFSKLGNTPYSISRFLSTIPKNLFYPISYLANKRRDIIKLADLTNKIVYPFTYRRNEDKNCKYPYPSLQFSDNVSNDLAIDFYKDHGVSEIEKAAEVTCNIRKKGERLMTTRHCILREIGLCRKNVNKDNILYPLFLDYKGGRFRLDFDCKNCEMHVLFEK